MCVERFIVLTMRFSRHPPQAESHPLRSTPRHGGSCGQQTADQFRPKPLKEVSINRLPFRVCLTYLVLQFGSELSDVCIGENSSPAAEECHTRRRNPRILSSRPCWRSSRAPGAGGIEILEKKP